MEEDKNDRGERSGDPFAYRLMRAESAAGDWDPVPRVTITERSKFISALLWLTRIGVVMVGIFLLFVVVRRTMLAVEDGLSEAYLRCAPERVACIPTDGCNLLCPARPRD